MRGRVLMRAVRMEHVTSDRAAGEPDVSGHRPRAGLGQDRGEVAAGRRQRPHADRRRREHRRPGRQRRRAAGRQSVRGASRQDRGCHRLHRHGPGPVRPEHELALRPRPGQRALPHIGSRHRRARELPGAHGARAVPRGDRRQDRAVCPGGAAGDYVHRFAGAARERRRRRGAAHSERPLGRGRSLRVSQGERDPDRRPVLFERLSLHRHRKWRLGGRHDRGRGPDPDDGPRRHEADPRPWAARGPPEASGLSRDARRRSGPGGGADQAGSVLDQAVAAKPTADLRGAGDEPLEQFVTLCSWTSRRRR